MAQAAYASKVRIRTTTGAGSDSDALGGCNDVSFPRSRDELDVTEFGDSAKDRLAGLKDAEFSLSGNWPGAADTGYARLETAYGDGSTVHVVYLPNGTTGFELQAKVLSLELSGSVDGLVTFSASCKGIGAAIAAV
jgi:predicted secreted protein